MKTPHYQYMDPPIIRSGRRSTRPRPVGLSSPGTPHSQHMLGHTPMSGSRGSLVVRGTYNTWPLWARPHNREQDRPLSAALWPSHLATRRRACAHREAERCDFRPTAGSPAPRHRRRATDASPPTPFTCEGSSTTAARRAQTSGHRSRRPTARRPRRTATRAGCCAPRGGRCAASSPDGCRPRQSPARGKVGWVNA